MNDSPVPIPLARLLAMGYQLLIDELHERLTARGWIDVRPAFGFVLLALRDGPASMRELIGALGTSKQAVSKLVDGLVAAEYADRSTDPADGRAKQVRLTVRGRELLSVVEQIYAELEAGWAAALGQSELETLRGGLEKVVRGAHGGRLPVIHPVG